MAVGRQHKMWFTIDSDIDYANDKSFGGNRHVEIKINVGRSSKNTKHLATIVIDRTGEDDANIKLIYK